MILRLPWLELPACIFSHIRDFLFLVDGALFKPRFDQEMEEDVKKGSQGSCKARRAFWSLKHAWSEVFKKYNWRVSGGCFSVTIKNSNFVFFGCTQGCNDHLFMSVQILDCKVFPSEQFINGDDVHIGSDGFTQIDDASVLYCERFMEFLIDLLSQLPTRR